MAEPMTHPPELLRAIGMEIVMSDQMGGDGQALSVLAGIERAGFVVVPVEPTPAILWAYLKAQDEPLPSGRHEGTPEQMMMLSMRGIWAAMLAATRPGAPQP